MLINQIEMLQRFTIVKDCICYIESTVKPCVKASQRGKQDREANLCSTSAGGPVYGPVQGRKYRSIALLK